MALNSLRRELNDVLQNQRQADAEGNTRTFSIASPSFENQLIFATRMRDSDFPWSEDVFHGVVYTSV
jgi:hypothetical protein